MDSLTQIVLGAAVGEAVLGKRVGNKALLYGAIAGTIPDLDVILGNFTDTITIIEWHRGFSHSIIFSILMAPILGWLVNQFERKLNLGWKTWAALFFWGLITHALLDAFTTWGTQLFWPFNARIAFNSIFVIDPLYTLPFLTCTILVLFYKRTSPKRQSINRFGLKISTLYLISTLFIKYLATEQFKKALDDQNVQYTKISTRPAPFNTILWNANIDTPAGYLIADYSFLDTQPIQFKHFPKNRVFSNEMLKYPDVNRMIEISQGWYILEQKDNEWIFNDLRFGTMPKKDGTTVFTFSYKLKQENNRIIATETPKDEADFKFLMPNLWKRMQGR
ncbi:MAG: metal-dependent hydrolase [Bacteroidetes bacterium MedPE-SWsnd-G1]|nr:MAG: metal-dependent hydrolase [Bacteroidetes bacterium MedPE-SWsnd-G1]